MCRGPRPGLSDSHWSPSCWLNHTGRCHSCPSPPGDRGRGLQGHRHAGKLSVCQCRHISCSAVEAARTSCKSCSAQAGCLHMSIARSWQLEGPLTPLEHHLEALKADPRHLGSKAVQHRLHMAAAPIYQTQQLRMRLNPSTQNISRPRVLAALNPMPKAQAPAGGGQQPPHLPLETDVVGKWPLKLHPSRADSYHARQVAHTLFAVKHICKQAPEKEGALFAIGAQLAADRRARLGWPSLPCSSDAQLLDSSNRKVLTCRGAAVSHIVSVEVRFQGAQRCCCWGLVRLCTAGTACSRDAGCLHATKPASALAWCKWQQLSGAETQRQQGLKAPAAHLPRRHLGQTPLLVRRSRQLPAAWGPDPRGLCRWAPATVLAPAGAAAWQVGQALGRAASTESQHVPTGIAWSVE